jgi:ATP-dependent DNA helicase RecG
MPSSPDSGKPASPLRARKRAAEEAPPIQYLKGIGPAKARLLEGLGLRTPVDLLHFFPRAHEDRRTLSPVASLRDGEAAVVRGRVLRVVPQFIPGRRPPLSVVRVQVGDDSGTFDLEFWNQPWRKKQFREGDEVVVSGKASKKRGARALRMTTPEVEIVGKDEEDGADPVSWGRVVPIYPLTKGVRQRDLRLAVRDAIAKHLAEVVDPLPPALLAGRDLLPLRDAVREVHFPSEPERAEVAKRRLRFDELLFLQIALALRRRDLAREVRGFTYSLGDTLDRRIRDRFPFRFTAAQDRAVADLLADFASPHPMNRLLQGDVGSGKTAVALYAMLVAVANKRQAAILAPTEILAEQHVRGFDRTLEGSRVRIRLLAGRTKAAERRAILAAVRKGEVDVLVSTHAVLEGDVEFRDLGVAVVDEQHRFGVHQRKAFRAKGLRPDLLHLTATPIPRTLALTAAGDLDVSVIDERPPGRHPVRTVAVEPGDEEEAYDLVRRECAAGRRAFFVCPLVEESEELDLVAAEEEAVRLRDGPFRGLRVGLLHGRMKGPAKSAAMEAFRTGRTQVLVTTVVVEVGVDVPDASVLAVLHAERFGLSTLHQLRGRIGRGSHESVCLLFADPRSEDAKRRIDALLSTEDGFRIAEIDLRIRGPGEFFGSRQSGLPDLQFPESLLDYPLLETARGLARDLVERDPDLTRPENRTLREAMMRRFGERLDLLRA